MADEPDGPRFPPPSQEAVAHRALCLSALLTRGELEYVFQAAGDAPEGAGLPPRVAALERWMSEQGVREHLSPLELTCFVMPLGEWPEQAVIDASWRADALGTLLWALSVLDTLPPYDRQFGEAARPRERISANWLDPVAPFLARVRLRPTEELAHARDVAELWHWRAVSARFERGHWLLAKRYGLRQARRQAAEAAYRNGDTPAPIEHDLPALGKSYARLTEQERSGLESIACERHFALNWLCGYAREWDNTPTDT